MKKKTKSRDLIVHLIIQDMIHAQLVQGLRNTGLDLKMHHLSIINVVVALMGGDVGNDWMEVDEKLGDIYFNCLRVAENQSYTGNEEALRPLAEACYEKLSGFLSRV